MLGETLRRSLVLICVGATAMWVAMGIWYWVSSETFNFRELFVVLLSTLGVDAAEFWWEVKTIEIFRPLLNSEFFLAVMIALLSGFIYGFAGFGGGLTMVPLMALVYWPTEAVIISCLLPVITGVVAWPGTLHHVQWRHVVPSLVAATLVTPIGAYFLIVGDPGPIRTFMGLVVLLFAIVLMFGWSYRGPQNAKTSLISGTVGGIMQGYLGMAGAWFSLYFLSGSEPSRTQRANLYITMMVVSGMVIIPHIVAGTMGQDTWARGIALVLPYGVAVWLGASLFRVTSDRSYRRVAIWLLFLIGIGATIA